MNSWMPLVRLALGAVTAIGVAALVANTIITGRDIPAGLLTLLTSIVGAVFGLEAVERRKGPRDD